MNSKKAKMIRQAVRANGADPKDVTYEKPLPYISAWFTTIQDPITGQDRQVKQTDKPLKMANCGRRVYKVIKKDLRSVRKYRTK